MPGMPLNRQGREIGSGTGWRHKVLGLAWPAGIVSDAGKKTFVALCAAVQVDLSPEVPSASAAVAMSSKRHVSRGEKTMLICFGCQRCAGEGGWWGRSQVCL